MLHRSESEDGDPRAIGFISKYIAIMQYILVKCARRSRHSQAILSHVDVEKTVHLPSCLFITL